MIDISLDDKVAVLIDADNAQLSYMERVIKFAGYFGELKISRAYGDWESSRLTDKSAKMNALKIEPVQVNQVGKNPTDHRLLMDAGELLVDDRISGDYISVFIIVSGDGDFASACERIKERGRKVIGIGNKLITSNALLKTCDQFYYLKDLEQELAELEARYPIPPDEARSFFRPLFHAYDQLDQNGKWAWIPFSQLGAKLHEILPGYKSRFGKYPLSEWLKYYEDMYECRDQMIRRIDPNPCILRLGDIW